MTHLLRSYPLLFEPGDRMSREEFISRWERMPELKNAELIDGVVYMPSPVSKTHSRLNGAMHLVVGNYVARTPGCEWLPNATWYMLESAPQPDVALCSVTESGGGSGEVDDMAAGAPELAVEITKSRRSYDLGPKLGNNLLSLPKCARLEKAKGRQNRP